MKFSENKRQIKFSIALVALTLCTIARSQTTQPIAVIGETIHTMMNGAPLANGVVILRNGKIESVGAGIQIPPNARVIRAKVVTPGLIDAHTVVGLQGYRNEPREQDQIEKSAPIQPELRAVDAYNAREKLVEYVRGFGITTIHTGFEPGVLVPGQSMIVKTRGATVDEGLIRASAMLSITLGEGGLSGEQGKAPGTRPKEIAMLRAELIKAQDYDRKRSTTAPATAPATQAETPSRDLRLEVLARVIRKELPLLITAHRAQDILLAIKLAKEYDVKFVLDGASEAYLMIDQIKESGASVILHPTMKRSNGEAENLSFETASKLRAAGIRVALQSGYEGYVPKTRIVLFEAGMAAGNGLSFNDALATITIDSARILGVDDRIGSIQVGKDADLALFDGDPFEFTTHCVGTIIDGQVVSEQPH